MERQTQSFAPCEHQNCNQLNISDTLVHKRVKNGLPAQRWKRKQDGRGKAVA